MRAKIFGTPSIGWIDATAAVGARGALFVAGPEQADIRAHAKVIGEEFGECLVSANEATTLNPLLRAETLGECFYCTGYRRRLVDDALPQDGPSARSVH